MSSPVSEADVLVQAGVEPDVKVFQVHSDILRARSPYFQCALSERWARMEGDRIVLKKPNVSPTVFGMLLDYLYNGSLDLSDHEGLDVLNLLIAADELMIVQELLSYTQHHLINEKTSWFQDNFGLVLHTVFRYTGTCEQLQEYCLSQICWRPELVFSSEDFLSYEKDVLLLVLQQDNLQMQEKDVWEKLLRWGVAQISGLEWDVTRWSRDDFQDLYETLSDCIPLIRFTEFSIDEFYKNVLPFIDIIPEQIRQELRKIQNLKLPSSSTSTVSEKIPNSSTALLLLPRQPIIEIDSTILQPAQAARFPKWIESSNKTTVQCYTRLRYQFQLLVRGSRDGFTPEVFHERCDHQGPNIVVCRIKGTGQIIGGYNPIGWRGLTHSRWQYSNDSFLFSFGSGRGKHKGSDDGGGGGGDDDVKISRVQPGYEAIYDDPKFGPCFGKTDLDMRRKFDEENNCSTKRHCYGDSITSVHKFSVEEYEVFKIVSSPVSKQ